MADLQLIGCWLGGSAAIHARRVAEHLGPKVPLRDLGFLASEGRFTIPVEDNSAAGPLAVHTSFFEFVPEEEIEAPNPSVLLAHELGDGGRYYVILSGANDSTVTTSTTWWRSRASWEAPPRCASSARAATW